ncbi:MAG TPA: amidohydrolase family protein [Stellaceae bacterium]|nr:amidohydrolase family protein [Stellaceae bacterium]
MAPKPYVIALEEHYYDPEVKGRYEGADAALGRAPHLAERLDDIGALRLREMDEAGVDLQVLSHGAPSVQKLDPESAVAISRRANDRLNEACRANPKRLAAFCVCPTPDPKAAADELERTVTKYGFKGAMIHGLTNGVFHDDKRFWPIYERAQALDVPIYLHPGYPHKAVVEAYYKDYIGDYPIFATAGWGFGVETATQGIRLVLSGVFEAYPKLQIILGHLGEGLPFFLWRINQALSRDMAGGGPLKKSVAFRDTFCEHFYITTSGFFSDPALQCCITELGIDRVMFSIDYPFVANKPGTAWINALSLNAADKEKILNGNARRLLKI